MDGEVVLSPVVHPPKSTAAAYNVYPFSGGGRRLPLPLTTFAILRCPKLSPGTPELRALERVVCTARTRVDGTRSRMILGGWEGYGARTVENLRQAL